MKNTSAFNDRQEVEAKQFKILKIVLLQLLVYLLLFFLLLFLVFYRRPLLTSEKDKRSKELTFFIFFVCCRVGEYMFLWSCSLLLVVFRVTRWQAWQ